jgi:hypothetical protein
MIHQTEIPTLLDSWVTTTPSVKTLPGGGGSLYFRKNITCSSVGLNDLSDFFCFLLSCLLGGYDKLLFHECSVVVYFILY